MSIKKMINNKKKINWTYQNRNFCLIKDHLKRLEKTRDGEKIFISHITDNGLISRLYKEL